MSAIGALLNSPDALQAWADKLPKHDASGLANQVMGAIAALTKTPLEPMQALAALEIVREPVYRASRALSQGFVRDSCGITADNQKAANAALQLLNTLGNLYGNLLPRLHQEQAGSAFTGMALHRSMAGHIAFQQICYQLYLPIAEKQWLKLHKRFLIAHQFKLTQFACADNTLNPGPPHLSTQQLYCVALLLGCARTNQLSAKDIALTTQLLYHWAPLVQIGNQPVSESGPGLVVDIRSDAAPSFQALATLDDNALPCYLRMDGMMGKIKSLLEAATGAETATPAGLVATRLLEHLQSAWGEFIQREERVDTDEVAVAAIGLENMHYYLCGAQTPDAFIGPQKMRLSIAYEEHEDVALIESQRSGDVWSKFLSKDAENLVFGATPGSFDFQQRFGQDGRTAEAGAYPTFSVHMLDKSEHGCQLEWPAEAATLLSIGEIIGIQSGNAGWLVGEIAWQTRKGTESIRTGVRLISRQPIPLSGEKIMGMTGPDWLPIILLPQETGFRENPTAVIGSSTYKSKDLITVCQKGIERKIQLVERSTLQAHHQVFAIGFVLDKP